MEVAHWQLMIEEQQLNDTHTTNTQQQQKNLTEMNVESASAISNCVGAFICSQRLFLYSSFFAQFGVGWIVLALAIFKLSRMYFRYGKIIKRKCCNNWVEYDLRDKWQRGGERIRGRRVVVGPKRMKKTVISRRYRNSIDTLMYIDRFQV